ncbi:MAG: 30S ribosomal protein S4 [Chloroflexota bacterium]
MARYTGSVCKLCRRIGSKLLLKGDRCLGPKCAVDRRTVKPQRGTRAPRRRRVSDRGLQLREKQKARYTYGVLERQFRRFFSEAQKTPGITAENLVMLLERRLDNVVFRLGFADSRVQSRQVVRHGHILLNGHRCDVPSCLVKPGDSISWHQSSTRRVYYKALVENIKGKLVPGWLSLDPDTMVGRMVSLPAPGEVDTTFDGKAIVEYYSK